MFGSKGFRYFGKETSLFKKWMICVGFLIYLNSPFLYGQDLIKLESQKLQLNWEKRGSVFELSAMNFVGDGITKRFDSKLSNRFTFLYSETKPDADSGLSVKTIAGQDFPGDRYKHYNKNWNAATSAVNMNTAGLAFHLVPTMITLKDGKASLRMENEFATILSEWTIRDFSAGSDLLIRLSIQAKKDGYYSLATPTLLKTKTEEIKWATVPGYFQGDEVQKNLVLAYAYGQGIPDEPIIFKERTASTLTVILSRKDGITISATADPGYGRDPWRYNEDTHNDWNVGLSVMNWDRDWSPTLYFPVLGEQHSFMKSGETRTFSYHFSVTDQDWFSALKHAINDVYQFPTGLTLRENRQSLINRIWNQRKYLTNDRLSMWRIENFRGVDIGAQAYLGSVVGSQKDAMKNSDYGAMWMMATIMDDSVLKKTRLPYARNFKLMQQQTDSGFFKGAAMGQYYLSKSKKFTEEWGEFVEPISLTYYTMLDMGNILLFQPEDEELKDRLRAGADLLMHWQHADGSWEMSYDRSTHEPVYPDLKDYRPTFYGLIVAHRILGDVKYLNAARKGADWYYHEAIKNGKSLGVCGDARYVPDFALAQTAQAFLDLYAITKDEVYKQAAIESAKFYVSSVYTHPVPSVKGKLVNGVKRYDWEIAQAGLSFEHGGTLGSANFGGPVLLSSHAGMFIRMFEITKDSVFLNMARAAAIGRDAFVDSATSVASYYWARMNRGAGPFPHHAWWQTGWIMDYLLSELHLRSNGQVSFPRGFVTPKVGPHQSYGFAPGKLLGESVDLRFFDGLIQCSNPNIEYITAWNKQQNRIHILLLNDLGREQSGDIVINAGVLQTKRRHSINQINQLGKSGKRLRESFTVKIEPYGLSHFVLEWR